MEQNNSPSNHVKTYAIRNGQVHIHQDYFITEFKVGVNVNFSSCQDLFHIISQHFSDGQPYGMICNRAHRFSVNMLDSERFHAAFPGLVAKAVVTYTEAGKKAYNIENYFCQFQNRQVFNSIPEAESWILEQVSDVQPQQEEFLISTPSRQAVVQ